MGDGVSKHYSRRMSTASRHAGVSGDIESPLTGKVLTREQLKAFIETLAENVREKVGDVLWLHVDPRSRSGKDVVALEKLLNDLYKSVNYSEGGSLSATSKDLLKNLARKLGELCDAAVQAQKHMEGKLGEGQARTGP